MGKRKGGERGGSAKEQIRNVEEISLNSEKKSEYGKGKL